MSSRTTALDARLLDAGPGVIAGTGVWRPDGRHIAFIGWQAERQVADVYIADADGSNIRRPSDRVADRVGGARRPGVVPRRDAAHLRRLSTHHRGHRRGRFHDRVARADARPGDARGVSPTWSPAGSRLALLVYGLHGQGGGSGSDGSDFRLMGPGVVDIGDADFVWAPDGRSLVITGAPAGGP